MNNKNKLVTRFIEMFGCDTARICRPCGTMFLIIGHNQNTKADPYQHYKNGEPYDFDYVREEVIASGNTEEKLIESAKYYKKLCGMTMEEYVSSGIYKE